MRRILFSSFLILLVTPGIIFAQRDSLRTVFLNAESWFLFEEYSDALPLYEGLQELDPGNDNLNYKIGVCLLNDPYQKDKAIQYLLNASQNINPAYKENSFKERKAPPDALYYLGNAYQVNELLNRAIESYEEFLMAMDSEVYDEELVRAQIRSCKNAQRLKTMPVDLDLTLIDSIVNTRYSDINPVISGDGTKLAFVTELPFYDGAFYSQLTEDGWSYPQIITQMMGFDADVYPVALSHDGSEMILYYDDDYIGNLYYSKLEDGLWSPATKLGPNISTKYWESHASFSKDGQTLYFTSNRKGTTGGLDIYLSEKQADGNWGVPVNLGNTINTRYNEESPYISEDGTTLYFSSYGHYNMGGYDIFFSKKNKDGTWSEPVNMGYPINTTDDDLFFHPINEGNGAYYSVYSPSGIGRHDIYYMNIYSVDNPRLYAISGRMRAEDGTVDSTRMAIYVIDTESGDTIVYTAPDAEGEFAFELKQGIYELHFTGEGYEDLIRPLHITPESKKTGIDLQDNIALAPIVEEPVLFEGDESDIKVKETQLEGVAGVPIIIPVRAPKGSTVLVRTYQDSVLVSTDTLIMEKRKMDLEIVPLAGESVVELEMTDEEGNIHRNSILISGSRVLEEMAAAGDEESPMVAVSPIYDDPLGIMLQQAQGSSTGPLHDHLVELDPETKGITNQRELFDHLYEESASGAFSADEVDVLLAKVISGGDAAILLEKLIANSEGTLKEYLEKLDLEKEGISTSEELLQHLKEQATTQGYEAEDVRKAMLGKLDQSSEAQQAVSVLLENTDGALHATLTALDPDAEGINSKQELYNYLYKQADQQGYSKEELDLLLANELSSGDAELLKQQMLEHADGALKDYLEQLDLEAEGIQRTEDLLKHLEKTAAEEAFDMEDVRRAMLESLDAPLEVERLHEELLQSTDNPVKALLESLDLRKEGIFTTDELIEWLYDELEKSGYSKKEIEEMLSGVFGEQFDESHRRSGASGWPLVVLPAVAGAGLLIVIIAWWRRRKQKGNQEN